MKGMAAMKYHFMLGLEENVSTFIPASSAFLFLKKRLRRMRTEEAHDERQGEEYECDPTQSPHCFSSVCFCFQSLGWLGRTANAQFKTVSTIPNRHALIQQRYQRLRRFCQVFCNQICQSLKVRGAVFEPVVFVVNVIYTYQPCSK